jgi:hypothetical protein
MRLPVEQTRSWFFTAALFLALFGFLRPAVLESQTQPVIDPSLFAGLEYRMVGPFRGGRVTAVTGIAEEPNTFFFGGTGGGVWKTDDAGHHWTPIADDYLTAGAVGAIDVADSDPNVIYVGTRHLRGNRLHLHPGECVGGSGALEDHRCRG